MSKDPRKNLPSASSAPRFFACPGSWLAEKNAPKRKTGDDAKLGTKRHALINSDTEDFENTGDEYTVTKARELREEAQAKCGIDQAPDLEEIQDKRLWLINLQLDEIFSGEFDCLYYSKELSMALIWDDKTLYGNHVEAKKNKQLMSYVVLVKEWLNPDVIYTGLGQPNLLGPRQLTMCKWEEKEMAAARKLLVDRLEYIEQPDLPRIPNKHCDYCLANTTCKEANKETYLTAFEDLSPDLPVTEDQLHKVALAEKLIKQLKKELHQRAMDQIRNGEEMVDWRIGKPRVTKSIDTEKALVVLDGVIDDDTLIANASISLTGLVEPFQKVKDIKTKKGAREELEALLESGDALIVKTGNETLKLA